MNTVIERFLIPLFVVMSVLYAFNSLGVHNIEITKVYHHTVDDVPHIEKARLSFYFSADPHVQEIKNKKGNVACAHAFFFPHAIIKKGECETMVKKINAYNNGYTVAIEDVVSPVRGVRLTFNSDSDKFAISYERFDSIGLHKGMVFNVYDKNTLNALQQTQYQPVLRTLLNNGNACSIGIDLGHGGSDSGAIGYNGLQEKDVCLAIGIQLSDLLQSHGYNTFLTRNNDTTVSLDERTAYVNKNHIDLLVSIHANYASNTYVCGVETFCLQSQLLKHRVSALLPIEEKYVMQLFDQRIMLSHKLAESVQKNICDIIKPYQTVNINRGVKRSVAQVLLGSLCPSILVEVGFVSNAREGFLLGQREYQNKVAQGIYQGILAIITT